ncbi:MAG TPA: alkaline phosphatase family protein [Solirubrobacteraceae bacterium]
MCPRSPLLEPLLERAGGRRVEAPIGAQGVVVPALMQAERTSSRSGLRLPSPRVSLLLVVLFLGFGVILGDAAGSRLSDTLASQRSPLKLVLPAAMATNAATAQDTETSTSAELSPSQPEPTPTPAAEKAAPVKAPSSSSGSSTEGGSSGSQGRASHSHGGSSEPANGPAAKLPPIKHVFVVMLSDEPYASVFGPASTAPYLSGTLEREGELLVRYDAVAHEELANELALISGQGPTAETAANCPNYTEIAGASVGPEEQVLGSGCVYPPTTQTLVGQLTAKHLTWRAYVQGIDESGSQAGACAHPLLGQADPTAAQSSSTGAYATFRNPFVYFSSIVGSPTCASDDVGLASLKDNLASVKSTPSFSYIVPDRCHDGNPTPCTPGAPAGMAPAQTLLKQIVPEITGSKAYKESGLLVITVDQAPSSGAFADSSSCCGQPLFPNDPVKTLAGAPRGGGTVGALLLSPYVKGATTSQEQFNHFSLLRTIEDFFSLEHLGYAGLSAVKSLEPEMFTRLPIRGK